MPRFDLAVGGSDLLTLLSRLRDKPASDAARALAAFESQFADWLGTRHAVFVPSARSGLYLLLRALQRLGRAPGHCPRVLVPSWTHASVPAVVAAAGWKPRFVDCEPATQNAEVETVPLEAWGSAWAVIVTHLYGCPARLDAWIEAARHHGLAVVEDCAQALGARWRGQRVGTFGDASYFSFALTKNFTTLGGGMIATADGDLAAALRESLSEQTTAAAALLKPAVMGLAFRTATRPAVFAATVYPALRAGWALTGRDLLHEAFDEPVRFTPPVGLLTRPHAAQAALGAARLPHLDADNERRAAVGRRLHELLQGTPGIGLPSWPPQSDPIFMSFMLRTPRRVEMMRGLLARGVDTSPGYLRACHVGSEEACPNAERVEAEQVHLPVYPRLTEREVAHVASAVRQVAERLAVRDPQPIMVAS